MDKIVNGVAIVVEGLGTIVSGFGSLLNPRAGKDYLKAARSFSPLKDRNND